MLGAEHPNTIACLNNLAINYRDLGDMDKALEHEHKAYELSVKVQGEGHPDTQKVSDWLQSFTEED